MNAQELGRILSQFCCYPYQGHPQQGSRKAGVVYGAKASGETMILARDNIVQTAQSLHALANHGDRFVQEDGVWECHKSWQDTRFFKGSQMVAVELNEDQAIIAVGRETVYATVFLEDDRFGLEYRFVRSFEIAESQATAITVGADFFHGRHLRISRDKVETLRLGVAELFHSLQIEGVQIDIRVQSQPHDDLIPSMAGSFRAVIKPGADGLLPTSLAPLWEGKLT